MPLRGLKIAVVVMGVMLVAGLVVLVATIAQRVKARTPALPVAAAPLDLPAGARIETIGVGADRLVLDLVLPDGNRQLLIIDPVSGRRLGAIPLRTSP